MTQIDDRRVRPRSRIPVAIGADRKIDGIDVGELRDDLFRRYLAHLAVEQGYTLRQERLAARTEYLPAGNAE